MQKARSPAAERRRISFCPICGARLAPGEQIRTIAYPVRGSKVNRTDSEVDKRESLSPGGKRIMHVCGCQHCLSVGRSSSRRCPVCHHALSLDDYLIGWLEQTPEKSRLKISGCTKCKPIHI